MTDGGIREFVGSRRLWQLYIVPVFAFLAVAYFTEDKALILVLNIVLTSLSVVVVIAFTPEQIRIVREGGMDRGAWFGYGIWWGFGALIFRAVEVLAWRYMGQPSWLINSDVTSWNLWASCVGAVAHIVKPGDLNDRLPRRETVRIGLIIGVAVAIGLSIAYAREITDAWRHQRSVWRGIPDAIAGPPPKDYRPPHDMPAPLHARPMRDEVPMRDLFTDQPAADGLSASLSMRVTPETKARLEQFRAAQSLHTISEAARVCLARCFAGDDRDGLGRYEPEGR